MGQDSARYMARSVTVGLVIALSPSLGIQMVLVGLVWIAVKRWRIQWDFNPVIAMAWTWTTNLITVVPLYYVYIITGRLLMGYGIDDKRNYEALNTQLLTIYEPNTGFFETTVHRIINLFNYIGIPLLIGSIPWMIIGGWLGYRLTLRSILAFKRRRRRKIFRKNARQPATHESPQRKVNPTDGIL